MWFWDWSLVMLFFFLPIVQYSEQDIRSRKLYLFLLSGEKVSEHPLNWVH